jgi:hypothetical protein
VAAAVGRLGLALAMMQHINTTQIYALTDFGIFSPHIYFLYPGYSHTYPQLETWLIAVIALIIFSLLETALLAAFALLTSYLVRSKLPLGPIVFIGRILIIFTIVQGMIIFDNSGKEVPQNITDAQDRVTFRNELSYLYHVVFTWLDDGTMIAAKVLRPEGTYHCWLIDKSCIGRANRAYVIVACLQIFAAYATYILAIIASLQLAQYLHWRREQRASSTPAPTTP